MFVAERIVSGVLKRSARSTFNELYPFEMCAFSMAQNLKAQVSGKMVAFCVCKNNNVSNV